MKELKKYAAIGGGLSLLLCWPLAVGQIGQNVITDAVKQMDTSTVVGEIVNYDRGYLSSEVVTRYTFVDPNLAAQMQADGVPVELEVVSTVKHGLLTLSTESFVKGWEDVPLTSTTVSQLNGDTDFLITLGDWSKTFEGETGAKFDLAELTLSGHATAQGDVVYELNMPSVNVSFDSGETLSVESLRGSGQGKQHGAFWLGEQSFFIDSMTLADPNNNTQFDFNQSEYKVSSSLDDVGERLKGQHQFKLKQLSVPNFTVNDLALDLSFGDFDSQSFESLFTLFSGRAQLSQDEIAQAIPLVETFFERGFYVSMDTLRLNIDNGEFSTNWKVTVPEGTTNVAQDPMQVVPLLVGNIDTYVSDQLVANYPFVRQGVDEGLVMEFVEQIEGGYRLKADLKDGNLLFSNGQQVPVFALLMPLLMQ